MTKTTAIPAEEGRRSFADVCKGVDQRMTVLETQNGEVSALLTKIKIKQYRQTNHTVIYGSGLPSETEELS